MNILCLGDSIVFGYGVARSKTWGALAAEQTGWTLKNAGVPGDTTGGMLARLPLLLAGGQKPDVLFLFGGQNDFMAGCPASVPSANTMAMGQQALSRGIRVAFSVPTPIRDARLTERWTPIRRFSAPTDELLRYRDFLMTLSDSFPKGMSTVIDFYTPFLPENADDALFSDGIHLTPAGQERFASVFMLGIRTLAE